MSANVITPAQWYDFGRRIHLPLWKALLLSIDRIPTEDVHDEVVASKDTDYLDRWRLAKRLLIDPTTDVRKSKGLLLCVRPLFVTIDMIAYVDENYVDLGQFVEAAKYHGWKLPTGFYTAVGRKPPDFSKPTSIPSHAAAHSWGSGDVPANKKDQGSSAAQVNVSLRQMLATVLLQAYVRDFAIPGRDQEITDAKQLLNLKQQVKTDALELEFELSDYIVTSRLTEIVEQYKYELDKALKAK